MNLKTLTHLSQLARNQNRGKNGRFVKKHTNWNINKNISENEGEYTMTLGDKLEKIIFNHRMNSYGTTNLKLDEDGLKKMREMDSYYKNKILQAVEQLIREKKPKPIRENIYYEEAADDYESNLLEAVKGENHG